MDLSTTIAPTSDQLDAVDLLGGPQTFTVEKVTGGTSEQPVNVYLAEFPRPWRPGKSMRRVLVAVWGKDGLSYAGKRLTLFCDPSVKFGGIAVGGVRISQMSHIDKKQDVPLIISRGKAAIWAVEPLRETAPPPAQQHQEVTRELINGTNNEDTLKAMWRATDDPELREAIEVRVHEIRTEQEATS